jgi:hypothetical protein
MTRGLSWQQKFITDAIRDKEWHTTEEITPKVLKYRYGPNTPPPTPTQKKSIRRSIRNLGKRKIVNERGRGRYKEIQLVTTSTPYKPTEATR